MTKFCPFFPLLATAVAPQDGGGDHRRRVGEREGAVSENSLVPALKIHPSGDRQDDRPATSLRPPINIQRI